MPRLPQTLLSTSLALGTLALGALAAGCTSSDTATCPDATGEVHLATQATTPDGLSLMLHQVGRQCPVVGDNTFHVYEVDAGDSGMADSGMAGMGDTGSASMVMITQVDATMPDMGHGSSQDPVIHSDDASAFDVYFQMAGSWQLALTLTVPDATAAQTVTFDLDVVDQ